MMMFPVEREQAAGHNRIRPNFVCYAGASQRIFVSQGMIRIIAIVAAVFGLTIAAAQAEMCNHLGRYNFSGGGEHPMSLTAKVGTTCESTFGSITGGTAIFTFKRLLLVSAPARGRIKLREGGYYVYTAPPTAGSDSFALKVCGSQNNLPGCATLKYSVTVN